MRRGGNDEVEHKKKSGVDAERWKWWRYMNTVKWNTRKRTIKRHGNVEWDSRREKKIMRHRIGKTEHEKEDENDKKTPKNEKDHMGKDRNVGIEHKKKKNDYCFSVDGHLKKKRIC